uniref:CSON013372 protein n=1 Tax=Culicoides sonorensis TaxID=179676 RepID=A0A336MDB8_CULSO
MSWIEKTDEYFRSLRLWDLKIDEAYLNFTVPSSSDKDFYLYGVSAECDRCPFTRITKINSKQSVITVDTAERLEFKVFESNKGKYVFDNVTDFICHSKPNLGEFGVYDIKLPDCEFKTALEPVNSFLSIIVVTLIIIGFSLLYKLLVKGYQFYKKRSNSDESSRDTELDIGNANKKPLFK